MRISKARRHRLIFVSVFALVALTTAFQGCGWTTNYTFQVNQANQANSSGGEGVDGKVYVGIGKCEGVVGVASKIAVSTVLKTARITRQNCQDLSTPVSIPYEDLKFASQDSAVFSVGQQIYDRQTGTLNQRFTLQFCSATGVNPSVENIVWGETGNQSSLFGSLTRSDGMTTGTLQVTPPAPTSPLEFVVATGQSSTFHLKLSTPQAGSLTYAIGGGAQISVPAVTCLSQQAPTEDGSSLAPSGAPQKPGLLSGYALRPAWKVAGVDYAVGPRTPPIKDPATISMPGVTVNTVSRMVTVNANNTTLDGYDFSLAGGWTVDVIGATGVRIVNSLFSMSAALASNPIYTDVATRDLYVGYTTFDGRSINGNRDFIFMEGQGLILEYCWLKDSQGGFLDFGLNNIGGGGPITLRYNLFENSGRGGASANYINMNSGFYSQIKILHNTTYQTPGSAGAEEFLPTANDSVQSLEIAYNTVVTTAPGAVSYVTRVKNVVSAAKHDNYFDLSGAFGFVYPGSSSPTFVFSNNFNMVTGQALTNTP